LELGLSVRAIREIERRAFEKLRRHPALRRFWREHTGGGVEESAASHDLDGPAWERGDQPWKFRQRRQSGCPWIAETTSGHELLRFWNGKCPCRGNVVED